MSPEELLNRLDIGEDQDTEFKSAEGGLPKSLWETLSAFANTEGGYIILGVEEKGAGFDVRGVRSPEGLLKQFWDSHNNAQKLSTPLCVESDVRVVTLDERALLVIQVPRATRTQRPVFINGNPLTGTYKRNYEGDYRCTETEVRQMLRDASDEPQDLLLLEDFTLADLDSDALKAFRNRFGSRTPDHPFLALDDRALLEKMGGWRRDRKTGQEGLTLAGLLMFGRERSLLDALPYHHVDYQEQLSDNPEERWTYRLTVDGTGEPNLFNFYYRVYPRLVDGLNVPFKLDKDAVRLGETHVHEALREALVNTLIHADHQSSKSITVIKRRDTYVFQNPGRLRILVERLYAGGGSDPRNPNLQKMFQMLGLGEKAGSGFQKILRAWREQHWFIPLVAEKADLEMTVVTLPVVSLIPEAVERELRALVGDAYAGLTELDRIILMLAHRFGEVRNSDVQLYRREHPREIGDRLKYLVDHHWIYPTGRGRGTRYTLSSGQPADLFAGQMTGSSQHYAADSQQYAADSQQYEELLLVAAPVRSKGRVNKELVRRTILQLCAGRYLTLRELAELLAREPTSIQNHYLTPMVKEGALVQRYPESPNHPQQGYQSANSGVSE